MENVDPIKRSRQLEPLSREHHEGLLFVWKLRQGLKNDTSLAILRNFCNWFWKGHIKSHFREEEKILLPYLPADNALAIQLKKEHDNIRELVLLIDRDPDKDAIAILADTLNNHIRFEERQVFNYLEKILLPDQLDEIFNQLEGTPPLANEWKEEFWLRRK